MQIIDDCIFIRELTEVKQGSTIVLLTNLQLSVIKMTDIKSIKIIEEKPPSFNIYAIFCYYNPEEKMNKKLIIDINRICGFEINFDPDFQKKV